MIRFGNNDNNFHRIRMFRRGIYSLQNVMTSACWLHIQISCSLFILHRSHDKATVDVAARILLSRPQANPHSALLAVDTSCESDVVLEVLAERAVVHHDELKMMWRQRSCLGGSSFSELRAIPQIAKRCAIFGKMEPVMPMLTLVMYGETHPDSC